MSHVRSQCERQHQQPCGLRCAACGHSCASHYYDGRFNGACSWVDPDARIAWVDGYQLGHWNALLRAQSALEDMEADSDGIAAGDENFRASRSKEPKP